MLKIFGTGTVRQHIIRKYTRNGYYMLTFLCDVEIPTGPQQFKKISVTVSIFGKDAERLSQIIQPGDIVAFGGNARLYTNKNNQSYIQVNAQQIEIIWKDYSMQNPQYSAPNMQYSPPQPAQPYQPVPPQYTQPYQPPQPAYPQSSVPPQYTQPSDYGSSDIPSPSDPMPVEEDIPPEQTESTESEPSEPPF